MRGAMIRLSELVTATGNGTSTEGTFGTVNQNPVSFNFFGNVSKVTSNRTIDQGKRYDVEIISIIARASEVADLNIGHSLTWEGEPKDYQVTDIKEADLRDRNITSRFKSYVKIEAKYTS